MNIMNPINKPQIAIIAPEVLPIPPVKGGGIETCVWETILNFQKYQAQVFSGIFNGDLLKIPKYEEQNSHHFYKIVRDDFQSDLIRITYLQFNNYFPYIYRVAKTLNQSRPPIVHIHSRCWYLPYLKRLLKYQPKIILHHHNHYFAEMADQEVIKHLKLVDVFCGVSDYTVNIEVLNRFPEFKAKCQTIYNGIDLLKFKPAWDYKSVDLQQKKQELGIPLDSKIILFVGRLVEGKGVAELVQALAEILPVNPLWRLVIVGSSWFGETKQDDYLEKLKKLSEPIKEMVVFTGYINNDDLPPIYACADIAVAPSIMDEPFGIVLLEAMASGYKGKSFSYR